MKRKFVFDAMEYDFSGIDEQTVVKETGVSTERIVANVMAGIKGVKRRSRFNRKAVWAVAAAAAAIAAMGTVTVGAMGGFNQAFGNWFAGEPKYGLFAGDNVSYSSDTVDIEFEGIAGDDNFVGAAMTIKNKDGSPFVDGADNIVLYGSNDIDVTQSVWNKVFHNDPNRGGSVRYDLEDESTIHVTAFYGDENGSIKGERMTVKEESLTAYRLEEAVGDVNDDYDKLVEKYQDKLSKDQLIFEYSSNGTYEDNQYYIATEIQIPLNFELGVTLNYKTTARNIEVTNGKELEMNGVKLTIDSLEAGSFGIKVYATVDAIEFPEEPDYDNMDELETAGAVHDYIGEMDSHAFITELDVVMKDGSHVTAELDTRLIGANSETSTSNMCYCVYHTGNSYVAIDPDEIELITAAAKPLTAE